MVLGISRAGFHRLENTLKTTMLSRYNIPKPYCTILIEKKDDVNPNL
jgi:hypothetical protein